MADPPQDLSAALAGRYTLEHELGRGGMATVYLATDLKHQRQVALKVVRPELAAALGTERFLREITLTAGLHHPHILPLLDSGAAGEGGAALRPCLWYTMPYVAGESLRDRLLRERQLPVEDAIRLACEVADALDYAHRQGIVHRDIKPENILLEDGHALVADFGIARAVTAAGTTKLTETGMVVGTPAYMSPEQGAGDQRLDGRSDLYSLGCVLYETLSGEAPYSGPTPMAIIAKKLNEPIPRVSVVRETVPAAVEAAIGRALAKSPADRFATAREFAEALVAPSPGRGEPIARRLRRGVVVAALAALTLVAGAVAVRLIGGRGAVDPKLSLLAVAPFVPVGEDTTLARLGRDLVVTLSTNLNGAGPLRALDPVAVLSQPSEAGRDRRAAAAMARRLGAGAVVHGSLVRQGALVRLDLGVFTSDSLRPLASGVVTGDATDLAALADSAALAILPQLTRTYEMPNLRAVTTASWPALRAYLDGEEAIAQGRWEDAVTALEASVREDSTFWEAYFAYGRAIKWAKGEARLPAFRILVKHFSDLPPSLQRCFKADWPWNPWRDPGEPKPPALSSWYLAYYASAVRRYPECVGLWWEYADVMTHGGPRVGYSKADRQAALEETLQQLPQLSWLWDHLLWATQGRDSAAVGRALAALARLEPRRGRAGDRLFDRVYRTGVLDAALADSVAREMREASGPSVAPWIGYGFPREAIDLARRTLALGVPGQGADDLRFEIAFAWAARGAWDSALAAAEDRVRRGADGAALDRYRLAAAGAWLGGLPPDAARASRRALATEFERGAEVDQAEILWLDGLVAVAEGNQAGLATALAALRQLDDSVTSVTVPSLEAFSLWLAGDAAGAGRLLAEREWQATDPFNAKGYGGHYFAQSVDRLAAERWLLAAGDTTQAQRLLVWHEDCCHWWEGLAGATLAPEAYLLLGRIEEARRHTEVANAHYDQVLRRYDLAGPTLRWVVTEAEAGRRRVSGGE
jgi:TolB-like protein